MTPRELLESVKLRFTPLMHDEADKLEALLVAALTAYQDRAGIVTRARIQQGDPLSFPCPADYLELVAVTDASGDWAYADVFDGVIEIESNSGLRYPLTVEYLQDLTALDLDAGTVPRTIRGILQNYLEALIAIPNMDRVRRAYIAQKMDVSNLPDEASLYQRKIELEQDMAARGAIPRAVAIYSAVGKV